MSLFDDAFAVGSDARYVVYGEPVLLTPRSRGDDVNGVLGPDPARAAMTVVGIWNETPAEVYPESQQVPGKASHKLSAGTVVLSVLKSALPFVPVQGDLATRVKTGQCLAVASQADDGITDWDLTLSAQRN